jgi:hypothetical protein
MTEAKKTSLMPNRPASRPVIGIMIAAKSALADPRIRSQQKFCRM